MILVSRRCEGPTGLDVAVQRLQNLPGIKGHVQAYPLDLSKTSEIERLADILKSEERLDILVANAGATWGGPFLPTPDHSNVKVLDLNVRSIFNLIRLCVQETSQSL